MDDLPWLDNLETVYEAARDVFAMLNKRGEVRGWEVKGKITKCNWIDTYVVN